MQKLTILVVLIGILAINCAGMREVSPSRTEVSSVTINGAEKGVRLVKFDVDVSTAEALASFKRRSLEALGLSELNAFKEKNPNTHKEETVAALGTVVNNLLEEFVYALQEGEIYRVAKSAIWPAGTWFLVRKTEPPPPAAPSEH